MTRSDYIRLAEALRASKPDPVALVYDQWMIDCAAIADAIKRNNPKFDRDLFMVNCGVVS